MTHSRMSEKRRPPARRDARSERKAKDVTPVAPRTPVGRRDYFLVPAVCGLLVLAVFAVFVQTVGHEFVNIDDADYVSENRLVRTGFSAEGVAWAFTASKSSHWHPLTWLSLMLDGQLYTSAR